MKQKSVTCCYNATDTIYSCWLSVTAGSIFSESIKFNQLRTEKI